MALDQHHPAVLLLRQDIFHGKTGLFQQGNAAFPIERAPLPGDVQLHGAAPAEAQLSRPGAVDAHAAARALLQSLTAQQRVCGGLLQSVAAAGAVAGHFRRQAQHFLLVQLHAPCRGNGHRVQHRLPLCLAAPQQLPGQVARQHQVRRQQHQQQPVAYFSPFHAFSSEAPRGALLFRHPADPGPQASVLLLQQAHPQPGPAPGQNGRRLVQRQKRRLLGLLQLPQSGAQAGDGAVFHSDSGPVALPPLGKQAAPVQAEAPPVLPA